LKKSYGENHVLAGFNLQLYEGENLVIMGKSGSGKSVMIKCLVGLEEPDSGTIEVMEKVINELEQDELDELRTEIGFLFQGSALYDSMSVRENLEFPLRRHTKKFGIIEDTTPMVMEALENVGLAHTIDLMPSELSGGMKRRIALARTLILQPKIILYDEPTTGLDPITSKEIILLMMSIQKKYNTSSIIITHDVDCARVISNRMILLVDNINYAEGTFEELSASNDPKIQAFFK
jgi:phospholipid/cholesterol/gamma-HCH transport system ATP-binding protein